MIDLEEVKTKLVQDYRQLWINKHRFELNDEIAFGWYSQSKSLEAFVQFLDQL